MKLSDQETQYRELVAEAMEVNKPQLLDKGLELHVNAMKKIHYNELAAYMVKHYNIKRKD